MSERLTPEQIASTYKGGVKVLRRLERYGYVIVHPDDVPRRKVWPDEPSPWEPNGDDQARGWNACRAHVFNREAK